MLLSVFWRTARDQRRSLVVWTLALAGLVGMYVAVYPAVKTSSSFANLIDQMPKTYRALFTTGTGADFTTPAGYLNTELLTFMGPLLVLVYAIGAGASATAGEEDRGTLDLLLANPVSRGRVLLQKFGVLATGVAVLMGALWVSLLAEGAAAGMRVPLLNSAAALVHMGLLGVEFGALAILVGALTGHLAAARGLPALIAVVAYLVNAFAPLASWIRPLRSLSPFYQYIGNDPLRNGLSMSAVAVSVASIVAMGLGLLGRSTCPGTDNLAATVTPSDGSGSRNLIPPFRGEPGWVPGPGARRTHPDPDTESVAPVGASNQSLKSPLSMPPGGVGRGKLSHCICQAAGDPRRGPLPHRAPRPSKDPYTEGRRERLSASARRRQSPSGTVGLAAQRSPVRSNC